MPKPGKYLGIFVFLLLTGCTVASNRPVVEITNDDLKDHALLFGSIWDMSSSWRRDNVYEGRSVDGDIRLAIEGDPATATPGPGGIGEIRLFTQLVKPGAYQFITVPPRRQTLGPEEKYEAGQIAYLGQMVCLRRKVTCRWISIDQLGRDLYYASQVQPTLPWARTMFRTPDAGSSALDFRSQQVNFRPTGPAKHRFSGVTFPGKMAGFVRNHLETYGKIAGGAFYRHPSLDIEAQVLVYPMNLFSDKVANVGLSDRLREVVLKREASLALMAYQADMDGLNARTEYKVSSKLAVLVRDDGMRAGRRLDASGIEDVARKQTRFYIFSEAGWLIRYRFTWSDVAAPSKENRVPSTIEPSSRMEAAIRNFMVAQQWPVPREGAGK